MAINPPYIVAGHTVARGDITSVHSKNHPVDPYTPSYIEVDSAGNNTTIYTSPIAEGQLWFSKQNRTTVRVFVAVDLGYINRPIRWVPVALGIYKDTTTGKAWDPYNRPFNRNQ